MHLRDELIQIWKERINQRIDASIILIEQIKQRLSIPIKEISIEHSSKLTDHELCDFVAIESSLARQRKDLATSKRCLDFALRTTPHEAAINSFLLQFELGISFFVNGQWLDAIDFFRRASELTNDPICKSASLLNLSLCFENIGLSSHEQIQELKVLVTQFSGSLAAGINNQIAAYEFRSKWRANLLAERDLTIETSEPIGQLSFLKAYWSIARSVETRHSESQSLITKQINDFTARKGSVFNRDFRIRTLTLNLDPRDTSEGRLTDFVERLYLWVHIFRQFPQSVPVGHLSSTLISFPWENLRDLEKINLDDQTMLLLTIKWLSQIDQRLEPIAKRLSSLLKQNPINFFLSEQLKQVEFLTNKSGQNQNELKTDKSKILFVYLSDYVIEKQDHQKIHSATLSRALNALKLKSTYSVDEFYSRVFDGLSFDSFLNGHQLSSLLYKLNQLMSHPGLIRHKNGRIICSNPAAFETVQIIYPSPQTQLLIENTQWSRAVEQILNSLSISSLSKRTSFKLSFEILKAKGQVKLQRQDIQRILNLSKTEAHRLIDRWIKSGKMNRVGFGKATFYQILQAEPSHSQRQLELKKNMITKKRDSA